MPNWSVKIIADTVTPKLAAFVRNIKPDVEKELDAIGLEMVDLARSLAPYRTGFLRDSIQHRASGFTLDFWAEAYYAAYQELGTRFIPAHPFMRPSLDANQQKILDAIRVGCYNALGL
jgi:HK97 gp10 family phage protein